MALYCTKSGLVELRGRQWENGWRLGVDQMKVGYRVKKVLKFRQRSKVSFWPKLSFVDFHPGCAFKEENCQMGDDGPREGLSLITRDVKDRCSWSR